MTEKYIITYEMVVECEDLWKALEKGMDYMADHNINSMTLQGVRRGDTG